MNGWIGVDLDGTLAEYHGWQGDMVIGDPVPQMVNRVRYWITQGQEVRIFTARVWDAPHLTNIDMIRQNIQDWCEKHIGHRLEVTNVKDFGMIALWDDRAVRVITNEGVPCCDTRT